MSNIVKTLASGMQNHRARTTMIVNSVEQMGKAVRVVASFNRVPEREEARVLIENAFANRLEVVPNSFRVRKAGLRVTVAGFMRERVASRPVAEAASFKEIASNVYMDPADNSIWTTTKDGQIVRAATENLAELASLAPVAKTVNREPELALASVRAFVGPKNTQIVAYVDPENPDDVNYGVRVSEDEVYNEEEGITEVTQDMVVDTESLNGLDYNNELAAVANVTDTQSMTDYYSKVYGFDPDYFKQIESIISRRALV